VEIMLELEDATGIDAHALIAFQPGMRDARETLQWASMRVTTVPEDIAYSLFGIFGIWLPILYGENAHNVLGRLLQEITSSSNLTSQMIQKAREVGLSPSPLTARMEKRSWLIRNLTHKHSD
jgi:hypothetical protein